MENLTLELNIHSASDRVNVNLITKMDVYAKITIHGENIRERQKAKTTVDRFGGSSPTWFQTVKFPMNERLVYDGHLTLAMRLISRRVLGNKDIGRVNIPLLELLDSVMPSIHNEGNILKVKMMTYQVRTLSEKPSGTLTFSYPFKPDLPFIINWNLVGEPTYPPMTRIEHPPLVPPELPIEFPRLHELPYCSFVAGSSDDPLPIPAGVILEQANPAYNHTHHHHHRAFKGMDCTVLDRRRTMKPEISGINNPRNMRLGFWFD
ncbi:PREDICTED: protein SRC2-like [Camelina sativa]|uniref:Protein SRC2-like n=1 Tax=Camelina sativa TaxID=90675 RepID=A0ABM0VVR4_CAMSA|nr:PREDICTED: protein SRC2-like [Camelina sativa]